VRMEIDFPVDAAQPGARVGHEFCTSNVLQ